MWGSEHGAWGLRSSPLLSLFAHLYAGMTETPLCCFLEHSARLASRGARETGAVVIPNVTELGHSLGCLPFPPAFH